MMIATRQNPAALPQDQRMKASPTGLLATTCVCCIESGSIEMQTLAMLESLRKWGGRLADAPVLAVTPRFGPPLAPSTRRRLDQLGVAYRRRHSVRSYGWYNFLNKPLALLEAEQFATTPTVTWVDSDILFLGEPKDLWLRDGEDFAACTPDTAGATTGPDSGNEPFWREVCRLMDVSIDELPWVTTCQENQRIRFYWNGGIFTSRRSMGFGQDYFNATRLMLTSRVCSKGSDIFFNEQTILGLVVHKKGMRWRSLPHSHNYAVGSKLESWYDPARFREAVVLHHHDAMYPHFWPKFMQMVERDRPELLSWVKTQGPTRNPAPLPLRLAANLLRKYRVRRSRIFAQNCQAF